MGGVAQNFLGLVRGQYLRAHAAYARVTGLHGQHGVHEQPVTLGRGNAAGRGVRADDQAEFLQVAHDVANGGGGKFQPRGFGQRARAHRLSVGDIALYQRLEQ